MSAQDRYSVWLNVEEALIAAGATTNQLNAAFAAIMLGAPK